MEKTKHQKFVKMWNDEKSTKEISTEIGISRNAVIMYASRHRDECPLRKKKYDHDKLIALWKADVPAQEIADQLGMTEQLVFNYAVKHRENCAYRKRDLSDLHDKIVTMWKEEEATAKEISEKLGISEGCIRIFVGRNRDLCGYHIHKKSIEYDEAELIKMWSEQMTTSEIAAKLGISEAAVAGFVKTHRDQCKVHRVSRRNENNQVM